MEGILIRYNRRSGDRVVIEYKGENGYMNAINSRQYLNSISHPQDGWEVVVIGSDSLKTVQATHSRYFSGQDVTDTFRGTAVAE